MSDPPNSSPIPVASIPPPSETLLAREPAGRDDSPITDHDLHRAINQREHSIKQTLRLLARRSFTSEVNTYRREQAGQLVRDLLTAEAEVARYRLGLLVVASRRAAYLDHVRSQQWVAEAIVQHEIATADKLSQLLWEADESRDYFDHKQIASVKRRAVEGVLTDAEAEVKIARIKELSKRREANTLETIERLLTEHRKFLAGVHDRLAVDFRK